MIRWQQCYVVSSKPAFAGLFLYLYFVMSQKMCTFAFVFEADTLIWQKRRTLI